MEGWLEKKGHGIISSTTRRWFKLSGTNLTYSKVEGGPPIHEAIDMSRAVVSEVDALNFTVSGIKRSKDKESMFLKADTEEEKKRWVAVLSRKPPEKKKSPKKDASPAPVVATKPKADKADKEKEAEGGSAPPAASPKATAKAAAKPAGKKRAPPPRPKRGEHGWEKATFKKVSKCNVCDNPIYGTALQGQECLMCGWRAHHTCIDKAKEKGPCVPARVEGQAMDRYEAYQLLSGGGEESDSSDGEQNFMKSFSGMAKLPKAAIKRIWERYDEDKSNSLELPELKRYLTDLAKVEKSTVSDDDVAKVMKVMDVNGDGVIQWDEFVYFYQGSRDSEFFTQFKGLDIPDSAIDELWNKYDADSSGALDGSELKRFFRDMWTASSTKKTGRFFDAMPSMWEPDSGRDLSTKPVTKDEFVSLIIPLVRGTVYSPDRKK